MMICFLDLMLINSCWVLLSYESYFKSIEKRESNMIKIAITKGRIEKQVCKLLAEAGFDMDPIFNKDRELLIETKDGISMIFGKPNDVCSDIFGTLGLFDIGFVGKDTLDDDRFEDLL